MYKTPLRVRINFTYKCNLHCPFCSQQPFRNGEDGELPLDTWLRFLDELRDCKVFQLGFTGGEPILHPYFWHLIERTVQNRMRYVVISNGTLITKEVAERLAATKRCDYVQISIDGMESEHDAIRGKGAFAKSTAAIRYLGECGIPVHINTVITHNNFRSMLDYARMMKQFMPASIRLNPVNDGNLDLPSDTASLTIDDLADFFVMFQDTNKEELPFLSFRTGAFAFLRNLSGPPDSGRPCIRCSEPWYQVVVQPDGLVVPCATVRFPKLGNIKTDRIADIWKSPQYEVFRNHVCDGVPAPDPVKCKDCKYAYYCRRFCPAMLKVHFCLKELSAALIKRGYDFSK